MEIIIKAEITEEVFNNIPDEVKDQIKIKSIEAKDYKEAYKTSPTWKAITKEIGSLLNDRAKIEAGIRVELNNQ